MSECVFTIMVASGTSVRGYQVSCSSATAKKMFKEQELYDVAIIWHSRKPQWLENDINRKAA